MKINGGALVAIVLLCQGTLSSRAMMGEETSADSIGRMDAATIRIGRRVHESQATTGEEDDTEHNDRRSLQRCGVAPERARELQAMMREKVLGDPLDYQIGLQYECAQKLCEWCESDGASYAPGTSRLEHIRGGTYENAADRLRSIMELNQDIAFYLICQKCSRDPIAGIARGKDPAEMSIEEICMTFGTYSIVSYLPETLGRVDLKLLPTQESRDEAIKAAACSILEQRRYNSIRHHIDLQFAYAQNLVEWCRLSRVPGAQSKTEDLKELKKHRRKHRAGTVYHLESLLKLNRRCVLDSLHEIYGRELEARRAAGGASTAINSPVTRALYHSDTIFPCLIETLGVIDPESLPTQGSRDEALKAAACRVLEQCRSECQAKMRRGALGDLLDYQIGLQYECAQKLCEWCESDGASYTPGTSRLERIRGGTYENAADRLRSIMELNQDIAFYLICQKCSRDPIAGIARGKDPAEMSIEEICMTFGTYSIASYLPETLRRVDLKLLPTQESRDEALKAAACSILEQRREDQAMERDGALYDSIRRHIDLQFAHAQNLVEWCRLVGSSNARSNTEKLERHRREHRAGPAYHLECLLKLNRECMLDFLHEIYSRELEARGAAGEVSTAINTPVTHALHHFGKVFPYLSETLGGVNPKLLPTQESRDEALTAAICHALKLCSGIDRGKWVCVPLS